MSDDSPRIRLATPDDAAIIAAHRANMFRDIGRLDEAGVVAMRKQCEPVLREMLAGGEYVGWLAVDESGGVAGGAGVQLRRLLSLPESSVDREAMIVNVYVHPAYRRRGLARRLMAGALDWCREQRIERVSLHASHMGRPLYDSLGFSPTNEMVRLLR